MPAEHDYPDPALTEGERLEKKRYQSAFAFEMGHPPTKRSDVHACATCDHGPEPSFQMMGRIIPRIAHFKHGMSERFNTEEQYATQLQQQQGGRP
jgi:hypothetical protein